MDKLFRFSEYDILAYIASGFVAIAIGDVVFSTSYIVDANWTISSGTLTVVAAYVVGQILASPSRWLLERKLVHDLLGRPSEILLESRQLTWRIVLKRTILGEYYTPLDLRLRQLIRHRASTDCGGEATGEALFWRAFVVAKKDSGVYARMDAFQRLYGFCRNMAFVALVGFGVLVSRAIVDLLISGPASPALVEWHFGLLALLLGIGMLHRFLKFYRLYSVEVLTAYADDQSRGSMPQ